MRKHIFFLFLLLVLAGCNFHEVDRGQLYRSPQLDKEQFQEAIDKLGVKTIINLRGDSDKAWYKDEVLVAKKNGVLLIDIGMSARRLPHREDLIKLLDAFRNAPRPILIHCKAGVDRTGEASALYQMIYMGKSKEEALEMLSPKFAHFEKFKPAKRYFIRDVWQGEDWARRDYDPCSGQYQHYDPRNAACQTAPPQEIGDGDDT